MSGIGFCDRVGGRKESANRRGRKLTVCATKEVVGREERAAYQDQRGYNPRLPVRVDWGVGVGGERG